jgi:hypothetical protein
MKTTNERPPNDAPAAIDVEQHWTTVDSLAYYAARHLEDGASDDAATRRRYGRLSGCSPDLAERSYADLIR